MSTEDEEISENELPELTVPRTNAGLELRLDVNSIGSWKIDYSIIFFERCEERECRLMRNDNRIQANVCY